MGDLLFFIKSLVFTFIIVILMQIKVGQHTVEQRAMHWVQTSELVEPVKEVARGGTVFVRQLWRNITGNINAKFLDTFDNDHSPGRRGLNFQLERSEHYIKEQANKAKEMAQEQTTKARNRFRSYIKEEIDTQFDEFRESGQESTDEALAE